MEGCGDDALARTGGPRAPQPTVTLAPPSAALGQAVVVFRMLMAPSIVGADGAEPTRKRQALQGPQTTMLRPTAGWQLVG
jgi:hypothetical protein